MMKKYLTAILIYFSLTACQHNNNISSTFIEINNIKIENKNIQNDKIIFDYNISRKEKKNKSFKINVTLSNNNKDTIYFLTRTCEGIVYGINHDTSKITIVPRYYCHASYPTIARILPNNNIKFDATLLLKSDDKKISLSYSLRNVKKDFEINRNINETEKYQGNIQNIILTTKDHYIE